MSAVSSPLIVPMLSAGRHRNPRKGACFMEMASFLAGEKWSDHPTCTHPLLAGVARLVNDSLPDARRSELAPLIPSVIGLTGTDPRVDARVALVCALAALPVAPYARQNVLAVGVISIERFLAVAEGRSVGSLQPAARAALDHVPEAEHWARRFGADQCPTEQEMRRRVAPHTVGYAIDGLTEACATDVPGRLIHLLRDCIAATETVLGRTAAGEPVQVRVSRSTVLQSS